ncbi:hypothetical protein M446_1434 [Methylobacterium sp. 4-46]|uniref:hypothetical protein n=1 Tax=unclassified Methylobacterium TaxID=2615210 RepID=UPI000165C781|nr:MULTISPECIES: hypothetical protein [Methylobacterium]ACA15950.1 hypothetical protein M446_1434 [Methylobacterium sp. 4-46]WFT81667.1 hypothetical protein QA634_07275 [Methylobacterium nodulans]
MRPPRPVFRIPLLVGGASAAGLLGALLIEEIGPVLAWLGLSLPLVLILWHGARALGRARSG